MEVYAVAHTFVNWDEYNSVMKRLTDVKPVRLTDQADMNRANVPAAFLASLNWNDCVNQLETPNMTWEHVHMSFLIKCEDHNVAPVFKHLDAVIIPSEQKRYVVLLITASLRDWHYAVLNQCKPTADEEIRQCFNDICKFMKDYGYTHMFKGMPTNVEDDGTWSFR